jgi:hypothetical protein
MIFSKANNEKAHTIRKNWRELIRKATDEYGQAVKTHVNLHFPENAGQLVLL